MEQKIQRVKWKICMLTIFQHAIMMRVINHDYFATYQRLF